jgi:hypothetical protein
MEYEGDELGAGDKKDEYLLHTTLKGDGVERICR